MKQKEKYILKYVEVRNKNNAFNRFLIPEETDFKDLKSIVKYIGEKFRFDFEESVFAFLKDKDNLIPEKLGITIYKDGRFRNYSNMEKIEKQIKNLNLSEIFE